MAVPLTYPSLVTLIQQFANRSDTLFEELIPDFINLAINRIYSRAKNIGFEMITVSNDSLLTANQPFINKPPGWRQTISVQYTVTGVKPETRYLLPRTYEFCTTYWPDITATGSPLFYANYGNDTTYVDMDKFFISPTPDQNYPGQIIFLGLPLFNEDNPTNFLTLRYPALLVYGSLLEANLFIKNDERMAIIESRYNQALEDINQDTEKRYTDRTGKRDKD